MKKKSKIIIMSVLCASMLIAPSNTASAASKSFFDTIKGQVNHGFSISWNQESTITKGNGNGVDSYYDQNHLIYFYRGEVNDNNVIWADKCWKILRTTSTDGIKMIYNGEPTNGKCLATGEDVAISVGEGSEKRNTFHFGNHNIYEGYYISDAGYMSGGGESKSYIDVDSSRQFIFSQNVDRNGDTYTLDTAKSVTGAWTNSTTREASKNGKHYFCTNGQASCSKDEIGYIFIYTSNDTIFYLKLGGYDDIYDLMDHGIMANKVDSDAKQAVETWFEAESLTAHENDLEDEVYCNDRYLDSGALRNDEAAALVDNEYSAYSRVRRDGNSPSLICTNKADRFTVLSDSHNGNGKLKHKVGLITADELLLAGVSSNTPDNPEKNFLYADVDRAFYTMTPEEFRAHHSSNHGSWIFVWEDSQIDSRMSYAEFYLRPVVSLKPGSTYNAGNGTAENPYRTVAVSDETATDGGSSDSIKPVKPKSGVKNPNTADISKIIFAITATSLVGVAILVKVLGKRR